MTTTPGTYGESGIYPSKAAGYGTRSLMAMAGTLAEAAEEDLDARTPLAETPAVKATIAVAYATLALTEATRELGATLNETMGEVTQLLGAIQTAIELLPGAMPPP
jgi:hypothetical protein